MNDETKAAKDALARAFAVDKPSSWRGSMQKEAEELVTMLARLAKEAGFRAEQNGDGFTIYPPSLGYGDQRWGYIGTTPDGVECAGAAGPVALAIEYDVTRGRFVGTQRDETIVPTPGERYPMEDATLVLARAVVDAMAQKKA